MLFQGVYSGIRVKFNSLIIVLLISNSTLNTLMISMVQYFSMSKQLMEIFFFLSFFLFLLFFWFWNYNPNNYKCCSRNTYLTLTLSHLQQIRSRWLWKHLDKNTENFYKWKFDYWKSLKHYGKRRNCLFRPISLVFTMFSKDVCCRGKPFPHIDAFWRLVRKHLYEEKV